MGFSPRETSRSRLARSTQARPATPAADRARSRSSAREARTHVQTDSGQGDAAHPRPGSRYGAGGGGMGPATFTARFIGLQAIKQRRPRGIPAHCGPRPWLSPSGMLPARPPGRDSPPQPAPLCCPKSGPAHGSLRFVSRLQGTDLQPPRALPSSQDHFNEPGPTYFPPKLPPGPAQHGAIGSSGRHSPSFPGAGGGQGGCRRGAWGQSSSDPGKIK